jgi:hypothetical protein
VATVVSCIPDEQYPWDPTVVRAIQREFDPEFVPVFVKNVFRTATGGHFAQGFHAAAASSDPAGLSLTEPIQPWVHRSLQRTYGRSGRKRPSRIHLHFFNRGPGGRPVPNTFVPFDWNIYWFLISMRDTMTAQEKREFLEKHDPVLAQAKDVARADEQARNKERADAGYLARNLEAFDVTDWKRIAARGLDYKPNPATRPSVYLKKESATA